ncbi:MAG: hypothetical protein QNJ63_05740 [Calothrix sp. MO_192.B10]|nr:hypothetical protein [Calothrix sp. MO_192.B10]
MYRHIAIAVSSLGLLLLTGGCYQLSISVEPDGTDSQVSSSVSPATNNTKSPIQLPNPTPTTLVAQLPESEREPLNTGKIRISNKTDIPIRIVLLPRHSGTKNLSKDQNQKYNIPAHWDFASQEGSTKGLILSLSQGKLTLKQGDILVAFAEDGSRRYWGPYVVGETSEPLWNGQQKEWKLILQ